MTLNANDHTLYDGGRAPNPRRVAMYLAERGIEVSVKGVDMGALDHRSDSIAAFNPLMQLPLLVFPDGSALSETIAICRYFDGLFPGDHMFGEGVLGQARVEMWQRRVELQWLYPVAQSFRHIHPAMVEWEVPQVPEWGEANKPKAQRFASFLNDELADKPFVCGEKFSVADITAIVAMDFSKVARIRYDESLVHLHRWAGEMRSRPGYIR